MYVRRGEIVQSPYREPGGLPAGPSTRVWFVAAFREAAERLRGGDREARSPAAASRLPCRSWRDRSLSPSLTAAPPARGPSLLSSSARRGQIAFRMLNRLKQRQMAC